MSAVGGRALLPVGGCVTLPVAASMTEFDPASLLPTT
jgi:hypothetical protein